MQTKKAFPMSKVYQLLEPGPVVMVSQNGKANIMTMSWHMMIDFVPPIFACVVSNDNYSFKALYKTDECVINIPAAELAKTVVGVGNCSGATVDKFKKFKLTPLPASEVNVPLIAECFANLECKVINKTYAKTYNMFILEVVKAWHTPSKKRQRMLHHCGNGVFVIDGKQIKLKSNKL
jgi:flavin reductase (DIM6/NTAB) family NADH-FMN oxidoreductase RutF